MTVDSSEGLKQLVKDCTVPVVDKQGAFLGSGFFVAPKTVVTCAHVVASGNDVMEDPGITWRGKTYCGIATPVPRTRGNGKVWDPPDLCFIKLDSSMPDHPFVILGKVGNADRTKLHITGYNHIYDDREPQLRWNSMAALDGSQHIAGVRFRQIVGVAVDEGMSGGPILDLQRGLVCGVIKAQRAQDSLLGGLMIPAELIESSFPFEWKLNQRLSGGNSQWNEQRRELSRATDPATLGLLEHEWTLLVKVARDLNLGPEDFTYLRECVTGVMEQYSVLSLEDLLADLADRPKDDLDPRTKLFVWLAFHVSTSADSHRELLDCAIKRQGKSEDLAEYQGYVVKSLKTQRRPVLVIRLLPDPPGSRRLMLQMWRYENRSRWDDRRTRQRAITISDEGPHSWPEAKEIIVETLMNDWKLLGGTPLIEFALPDFLLDEPVEDLPIDGMPIGQEYPVVLRLAERDKPRDVLKWQDQGSRFRSAFVPLEGSSDWDNLWITCHGRHDDEQAVYRAFEQVTVPMAAMTAWHGDNRTTWAIKAVKRYGMTVILWQHRACTACPAGNGTGTCVSETFRVAVAGELSGESLYRLPERVKEVRRQQPADHGIAIIWDDPWRSPWEGNQANQQPERLTGW